MEIKPTILFIAILNKDFTLYQSRKYGLSRSFDIFPHKQSIMALTAWLREHGCDARYIWLDASDALTSRGLAKINKAVVEHPPLAFGFSLCTEEMLSNHKLMEVLKMRHPDIPIVTGGPHVTALPEHTLQNFPAIDYVVYGEGERTLTSLLLRFAAGGSAKDMKDVNGLAYRDGAYGIVKTAPREKVSKLDELPDPAWDLVFEDGNPVQGQAPFPLVCSYGCYFHCTFCSAAHGNYRCFSPERVVGQIRKARDKYGAKYFAIRDSFWPPSSAWLDKFCDEIQAQKIDMEFHFSTRVGTLSDAQVKRLRDIGARAVALGIEAGDEDVLRRIKKGITLEQARRAAEQMHEAGLFTVGLYMFGNPGETADTITSTINLAAELNTSISFFSVLAPFPGAEVHNLLEDKDKDWWMEDRDKPSLCALTPPELEHISKEAFLRYPLRMDYILQHIIIGGLSPDFRKAAKRLFLVHLRKYILGISERNPATRRLLRYLLSKQNDDGYLGQLSSL